MDLKKKLSNTKEYIKTTALYEVVLISCKFVKNHPSVLSIIIIAIFIVGVATYPIINKSLNNKYPNSISSSNQQSIYVTVTGEVSKPGMYELKADNRVNDVIQMAGGFTNNAYTDNINLAQMLYDGQYINVISKDYAESIQLNGYSNDNEEFDGVININTATSEELCQLPGISKTTALKIIEYREAVGDFECIEDIQNVIGIEPEQYEKIKYNITI